jgi:hypothetical protein
MKRLFTFTEFINEASFALNDPGKAGEEMARIISATKDVKEQPPGSNRGQEVDQYIKITGLNPAGQFPWCQSYVYWVLDQLSKKLGVTNPAPKTAMVKSSWDQAPQENKLTIAEARAKPELVRPGMVFTMERGTPWKSGGTLGHTGIILSINPKDKTFTSIEGNTDEKSSGEGNKVGINTRPLSSGSLIGFIDWFKGKRTPEFEEALSQSPVPGSPEGVITSEIRPPSTAAPSANTAGSAEAEQAALRADQEEDTSLIASLIKPHWVPSKKGDTGYSVSKGEVKKFLGQPTYSEEYKKQNPQD